MCEFRFWQYLGFIHDVVNFVLDSHLNRKKKSDLERCKSIFGLDHVIVISVLVEVEEAC